MRIKLPMEKTEPMFCAESAAASIAKWMNHHYELMFVDMLGFDFDYEAALKDGVMGKNLTIGFTVRQILDNLEKYHGIKVKATFVNSENVISFLKECIDRNMPIGMSYSEEYCDWTNGTEESYLLLYGYEEEHFLCYDMHTYEKIEWALSFKNMVDFVQSMKEARCETYYLEREERKDVSVDTIIERINECRYCTDEMLEKRLQMADYIEHQIDIQREVKGYEDIVFNAPLFLNITHILRGRKLLASSFEYIYNITRDRSALECSFVFNKFGNRWKKIWSRLQITYFRYTDSKSVPCKKKLKSISDELRVLVNEEYQYVMDLCNHRIDGNNNFIMISESEDLAGSQINELDISGYLNNRAFARSIENKEQADISGCGEYFYIGDLSDTITVNVYNQPVSIELFKEGGDNISCQEQTIEVDAAKCKKILFVGCAEWGEVVEKVTLTFENGKEIEVICYIADWYNQFSSKCIWSGDMKDVNGEKGKRSLFGYVYDWTEEMKLTSIQLPKNKNMHIFKILLINE